jgi:hypothetical protein
MRVGAADARQQGVARISELDRELEVLQRVLRAPRVDQDGAEVLVADALGDLVVVLIRQFRGGLKILKRAFAVAAALFGQSPEHENLGGIRIVAQGLIGQRDHLLDRGSEHRPLQRLQILVQRLRLLRGLQLGHTHASTTSGAA